MPRLEYFLVANSTSIDQITNRVSIFNVLEDLTPGKLPFAVEFVAISSWHRFDESAAAVPSEEDYQAIVRLHAPNGETSDLAMNFQMPMVRARVQGFGVLGCSDYGRYRFELLLNGEHIADHSISILPRAPADQ